jgi:ribosomal protein S18 acetylase RimI-like enzyme
MNVQGSFFIVRPLTSTDLQAVLEVYRQCEDFLTLGPVAHASMEMVAQDIDHSRGDGGVFCGIFDRAGQMIGIVDYIPHSFEGNPQHAFLSLLMIAQPYRRSGLGSEVVRMVEQAVMQNPQVTAILSAVQVNNPAAIRFWRHQGYAIVSEPELQPDGTTTVRLRKELTHLLPDQR